MSQDLQLLARSIEQDVSSRSARPLVAHRKCFSDLLGVGVADVRYVYDGAYRLPESLTLAQRSEFGLCERAALRAPFANDPSMETGAIGAPFTRAFLARVADFKGPAAPARQTLAGGRLGPFDAQTPSRHPPADAPRDVAANFARARASSARKLTTAQGSQYRCFTARVGEFEIRCIVFRGRSFAGAAPWMR